MQEKQKVSLTDKLYNWESSNNLNNKRYICYNNPDLTDLSDYKLLKRTLVDTGVSKSIIIKKNVLGNLLYHK